MPQVLILQLALAQDFRYPGTGTIVQFTIERYLYNFKIDVEVASLIFFVMLLSPYWYAP